MTSYSNKIKIAIIGAGYIAKRHLYNIRLMNDVVIKAIADIDYKKALLLANEYNTRAYQNYFDMIEKEKPDLLLVLTPPHVRYEPVKIASEYNIPVFLEKPIASTIEDGLKIKELSKKIPIMVGYVYRFHEATNIAKNLIGLLKEITLIRGAFLYGLPGPEWWKSRQKSGGQTVEQLIHLIDLVRYLVGEIRRVSAISNRNIHGNLLTFEVEDSTIINLELEHNIIASIEGTCNKPFDDEENIFIEIIGKEGYIKLYPRLVKLIVKYKTEYPGSNYLYEKPVTLLVNHDKLLGYFRELKLFIDYIKGMADRMPLEFDDAFRSFLVTIAIRESIDKKGEWINLNLINI